MKSTTSQRGWISSMRWRTATAVLALFVGLLPMAFTRWAQGQTQPGWTYTILHSFTGGNDGLGPSGGLIRDAAGNLYGVASRGGAHGKGTVFKVNTLGNTATLHSFTWAYGSGPSGILLQDGAGNLYGTTLNGGTHNGGVIYELTPSRNYYVLYNFVPQSRMDSDAGWPAAGVIRGAANELYGTTLGFGCCGYGTVFKSRELLYVFTGGADGARPLSGLIRDSAGNLYGTTASGGIEACSTPFGSGCGTVFKLDSSGNLTVLHTFTGQADGGYPAYGPLVRAAGGNLYGTTVMGGAYHKGTVFKLDYYGNFTVLHSFKGADGSFPHAGVIRTAAGSLFGTTRLGGAHNAGVVFKLDAAGNLTVLHNFTGMDGAEPIARLVRDEQNNLYGVTSRGGSNDAGVVFKLTPL